MHNTFFIIHGDHYSLYENGTNDIDYLNDHNTAYFQLSDEELNTILTNHKTTNMNFVNGKHLSTTEFNTVTNALAKYKADEIRAKATDMYQKYMFDLNQGVALNNLLVRAVTNSTQELTNNYVSILEQLANSKGVTVKELTEHILAESIHNNNVLVKFHLVPDELITKLSTMSLLDLYNLNVKEELKDLILSKKDEVLKVNKSKKVKN